MDQLERWDLIIVGAGAAGLATALWAGRLGLSALVLDQADRPGGQLHLHRLPVVDYPGLPPTDPKGLAAELAAGALRLGASVRLGWTVTAIRLLAGAEDRWAVETPNGTLRTPDLVLATGLSARRLGVAGEAALWEAGLVRRPSQERDWFQGRDVVVIGGGDRAVENAVLLAPVARSVTLVHRRLELRARPALAEQLEGSGVRLLLGLTVDQIQVSGETASLTLSDGQRLVATAVCPYVGNQPNRGLLQDLLARGDQGLGPSAWAPIPSTGEVETDRLGRTGLPGLWAVGDLATPAPFQSLSRAIGDAMSVAKAILLSRGGAP
jgi:thioredoxin reductase (NADPH)